jgi:hypothetical protein
LALKTASENLFPLAVILTQPPVEMIFPLAVLLHQPPVETYFHWRFCYTNRQWKYPISTGGCVKITASGNWFPLAVPKPGPPRFFTGAR